tara:strand:+ start:32 stop:1873 length:1842 start_codon:yes stop_codon:yes gene_type:complete
MGYNMATIEQLKAALVQAHSVGDTEAANLFASKIKGMQGQALQPQLRPEQAATPMNEDFIPTQESFNEEESRRVAAIEEQEIADFVDFESAESNAAVAPFFETQTAINAPFSDELAGPVEAAATMATGATTGALGFGLGTIEGAVGELTGRLGKGEGLEVAQKYAEALTLLPKTKEGQEIIKFIGEKASALPPTTFGIPNSIAKVNPLLMGKSITAKTLKSRGAKKRILVDEIKKGNPNIELIGKALNEKGDVITRPASKNAVSVLGGDMDAQGTVAVIEGMNPASKKVLNAQLDMIEKGMKFPLFKDANRPSDILGQSVLKRALKITDINKKAGALIDDTAKAINANVDIAPISNKFIDNLSELGVTFKKGDDGWVTPDFSRAKFKGGDVKEMTLLVNDLMNGKPDFYTAHKLKQTIRDNINYESGVGGVGQVKGASKQLLKDLSREIDGVLDNTSPKYKLANEKYAKTIGLKDRWNKLTGKDIDINDPEAAQLLGTRALSIDSKNVGRTAIRKLFDDTENVLAKDFKFKFNDNLQEIQHVTNKLNTMFKLDPTNSLGGNIARVGLDLLEASSGSPQATGGLINKAITFAKGEKSFKQKIRAIRTLTNQQDK